MAGEGKTPRESVAEGLRTGKDDPPTVLLHLGMSKNMQAHRVCVLTTNWGPRKLVKISLVFWAFHGR